MTSTPPRWARRTVHAIALLPLPSTLWRLLLVLGFSAGYTPDGLAALNLGHSGAVSLLLLCAATEVAALLSFVLVRRCGEVFPHWFPAVGGRPVPVPAVVTPALLGAAAATCLWTPFLFWWAVPHSGMTATGSFLVGFAYLPLVLWGPLLAAVTGNYRRRRRHPGSIGGGVVARTATEVDVCGECHRLEAES